MGVHSAQLCYLNHMPRKARIDASGAAQHVIVCGIERRNIIRDHKTNWGRISSIHYLFYYTIDPVPKALIYSRLLGHMLVAHGDGRT